MSEGFFSRWSRRKQELAAPPATAPAPPALASTTAPAAARADALTQPQDLPANAPADAPLPTLGDVQSLTPDSDFQPFMQRGVGAEVRNAAMKKLFADPHFNVMDGLDIYIDDYSQPDPMPAGMLRQMASAQFMKLVPEAPEAAPRHAQDPDAGAAAGPAPEVVAQSPDSSAPAVPQPHDHPDLQLQPDPAPAKAQPGPSPR